MSNEEILSKVNEIIADVFDDDSIEVDRETVASDVEGWDSLNHLQLMNEIEDEFEITFTMAEVQNFKNVCELIDSIAKHIG